MTSASRELLKRAHELRKKHRVEEYEDPFNVFSVLFRETDEVNLHSRFIAALLEWSADAPAGNLDDFLRRVLCISDFDHTIATIRREYLDIDILISNTSSKQAVVIENKILAEDQKEQLIKYHKALKSQGYCDIHLVYLTLDGRTPSSQSVGDLPYTPISYKDDLLPWLKCCQLRAQDSPYLRESIAQYIRIVKGLTGTDIEGAYMNDLIDLCLEDSNLVLVHDLDLAMKQARIRLLRCLWREIEDALNHTIPDLSKRSWTIVKQGTVDSAIPTEGPDVEQFVQKQGAELILRFPSNCPQAGAGIGAAASGTYYGVYCHKDHKEQYEHLRQLFDSTKNISSDRWPWYQYVEKGLNQKNPTRSQLGMLLESSERSQYAMEIALLFKERVWDKIKGVDFG